MSGTTDGGDVVGDTKQLATAKVMSSNASSDMLASLLKDDAVAMFLICLLPFLASATRLVSMWVWVCMCPVVQQSVLIARRIPVHMH